MASDQAIMRVLAFFHQLFPTRDIGVGLLDAWARIFGDAKYTDAALELAAQKTAEEIGREFFPTPGALLVYLPRTAAVSATELLRRIVALGHEGPHFEWVLPTVERVRGALGDGIAAAYGAVGPHRLNSDNPTTREIAERDFAEAVGVVPEAVRGEGLALASGDAALALPAGPPVAAAVSVDARSQHGGPFLRRAGQAIEAGSAARLRGYHDSRFVTFPSDALPIAQRGLAY